MLDVDFFKNVNDRYGHLVGDTALQQVAMIMQQCVREADAIARYGGEEFVIILPETDIEGALAIAERVRTEVAASSFKIDDSSELRLTVSLGIACKSSMDESVDIDKLLQQADNAMYRAKSNGRNRVEVNFSL
jgi:diguanylate cyclase (GGDEF)-like protein